MNGQRSALGAAILWIIAACEMGCPKTSSSVDQDGAIEDGAQDHPNIGTDGALIHDANRATDAGILMDSSSRSDGSIADTAVQRDVPIQPAPDVVVRPCSNSGPALQTGVWENVTPQAVNLSLPNNIGMLHVEVNQIDPATVYATADHQGLFRSTDCGANWTKINTGRNGATLDSGSEWTLAVDPVNPEIMYSSPLYGSDLALFKSTNGGVDWDTTMPPGGNVASALEYMFLQDISIDPTNDQHLVVTFHVNCVAPYTANCMAESNDAGATWRVFNGPPQMPGWTEDSGPVVLNATTFFVGAPFAGLFRTSDGGATWAQVASQGYHRIYRSQSTGWSYMGSAQLPVQRSRDLITWTPLPGTPSTVGAALVGTGEHIYASARQYVDYNTALESDGATWTNLTGPPVSDGASMFAYDPQHHLLYSINTGSGLWRIGVP